MATVALRLDLFLHLTFQEGDAVTAYLDLEGHTLSFAVNNEKLGDPIQVKAEMLVQGHSTDECTLVLERIQSASELWLC